MHAEIIACCTGEKIKTKKNATIVVFLGGCYRKKKGNDASDPGQVIHKVPANVMRYFPLKPRLQRLYMCKEYSKLMKWHDVGRQQDGKVRHPADTEAWKTIDADYPDFSLENRNVFRSSLRWIQPLSLNEPKSQYLAHYSPKNCIDVFMQPLIAELKELWEVGVNTYDALADEDFNLRARVLWTISDFPGYAMLSGWSTKGKLGCPVCHYETSSLYLKHSKKMCYMNHRKFLPSAHKWRMDTKRFNGAIEMGQCPSVLTGTDIEELLSGYVNQFGLQNKKFAIKKTTKAEVAVPLMKLSACLRALWSKVIDLEELEKLETEIVEVLCQFEMIFLSAFFDIMVHLLVHLTREVRLGGPQHLQNMFPIERYLAKLKSYVRNRSKPEGSIAEGYIAEECVTFCSRFLAADETTKNNMCSTVFERGPTQAEYHIGTRRNKDGTIIHLEDVDWKGTSRLGGRRHTAEFWDWLREEVRKMVEASSDLGVFALGPNRTARRFTGYVVNGYRFHTSDRDSRCTTQNSGVYLTAQTTSFSSSRYGNPIVGDVSYYGSIEDIIELDYCGLFTVVLFKCHWYQQQKDPHGHIRVNFNRLCHKSDPHVLAKQVQQVFYVEDPIEKNVHYVIKKLLREWCDNGNVDAHEDVNDTDLRETEFVCGLQTHVDEMSWMAEKHVNIGLYYGGEFQRTSYSGGDCLTIYNVDADM
ncbi:uncharacterized protein LOC141660205 [Apium graveolens]|uniref:uncharacterized protein LOC141660205 n=1 Tax=Apium graveolens TaxID=4045 RepID=UPI003D7AF083